MSDRPIKPVAPISPVREVQDIELRRRPSIAQLKQWLAFAKRKAKSRKARQDGEGE